jgi:SAM-dependent methyltransferase/uncharacterized protein YbaR (Trm112 family)
VNTKLTGGILARICCPICKEKLSISESKMICSNASCGAAFPVLNDVPILINESKSLFTLRSYLEKEDIYFRRHSKIVSWIFSKLPEIGRNLKADKNYKKFGSILKGKNGDRPKVCIIGGGVPGVGIDVLLTEDIEFINSDVALTPITDIVFDAHDIPFEDETFDGVIVQAVLEHVGDPYRCVGEIHRILKSDGIIYAEIPFLQQVHGGGVDYTRFTHLGMLRLFKDFQEIESGACCGSGMALAWSIKYFFLSFFTSRFVRNVVKGFANLTLFPLKYFDYLLINRRGTLDAASAYYFIGKKDLHQSDEKVNRKLYRGLM